MEALCPTCLVLCPASSSVFQFLVCTVLSVFECMKQFLHSPLIVFTQYPCDTGVSFTSGCTLTGGIMTST